MQPTDVTIEILKGIRDEVRGTNERLDAMNADLSGRIDATNDRLDALNVDLSGRIDRVERRQVESEVRITTELVALGGTLREMRDAFLEDRELRAQVADHERRIGMIEKGSG
jgi:uncharacterized protein YPO0396